MGLSWNVKYDESPLAMEMKYNKGQKIRGVLWLLKNIRKWNLYFVYWKLQLLDVLVLFGTWLRHRLGIESDVTSKGASTGSNCTPYTNGHDPPLVQKSERTSMILRLLQARVLWIAPFYYQHSQFESLLQADPDFWGVPSRQTGS